MDGPGIARRLFKKIVRFHPPNPGAPSAPLHRQDRSSEPPLVLPSTPHASTLLKTLLATFFNSLFEPLV